MREISLTQGLVTVVNDSDFEWLSRWKWFAYRTCDSTVYAGRQENGLLTPMHRVILSAKPGEIVDHADGDGLNNRRENLRLATRRENVLNTHRRRNNKSGYKGVCFHPQTGKWRASITLFGRKLSLGLFGNKIEAASMFDRIALLCYGEFARPNFSYGRSYPSIK